jgi:hypothetical protein
MGKIFILSGWWFQTWLDDFRFHIWDVIRQPLTDSIFQDGYCTSNQSWLGARISSGLVRGRGE